MMAAFSELMTGRMARCIYAWVDGRLDNYKDRWLIDSMHNGWDGGTAKRQNGLMTC